MTDKKASLPMSNSDSPTRFPARFQLKRTPGWRMPEGGVSVARPHMFGNPFRVGVDGTAEECVSQFVMMLWKYPNGNALYPSVAEIRERLAGRPLGCFCKPGAPCHADVLIGEANCPPPHPRDNR